MNLIADSGAILMTLMPLPRHSDLAPPSLIIWPNPPAMRMLLLLEEWTCADRYQDKHVFTQKWLIHFNLQFIYNENVSCVLPAWVLWAYPMVRCRFETLHRLLLQPLGVATTCLFSFLLLWTHQAPVNSPQHQRSAEWSRMFHPGDTIILST